MLVDEPKLVKRAHRGDKEAMKQLYELYADYVFNYIASRIDLYDDSLDVFQNVWLSVVSSLHKFRRDSSFKTWLMSITRNKLLDYIRGKDVVSIVSYDDSKYVLPSTDYNSERKGESKIEKDITKLLKRLAREGSFGERYANVIKLRFLHGYTIKEVAKELQLTEGSVKMIQRRALAKLRKIYHGTQIKKN